MVSLDSLVPSNHLLRKINAHIEMLAKSQADYLEALDKAIDEDRAAYRKKTIKKEVRKPEMKETKVSKTDKDSGYMVREGKPKGFFYLDHRTVEGKHAIITDTHVTAGNVHDSIAYLSRLDEHCEKFGFEPKAVGLDAGYMTAGICKGLHEREVQAVIGYRRPIRTARAISTNASMSICLALMATNAPVDRSSHTVPPIVWVIANIKVMANSAKPAPL